MKARHLLHLLTDTCSLTCPSWQFNYSYKTCKKYSHRYDHKYFSQSVLHVVDDFRKGILHSIASYILLLGALTEDKNNL